MFRLLARYYSLDCKVKRHTIVTGLIQHGAAAGAG